MRKIAFVGVLSFVFVSAQAACKPIQKPSQSGIYEVVGKPGDPPPELRIFMKRAMVQLLEEKAGFSLVRAGDSSYQWSGTLYQGTDDDEPFDCGIATRLVDLNAAPQKVEAQRGYKMAVKPAAPTEDAKGRQMSMSFAVDRFGVDITCRRTDLSKAWNVVDLEPLLRPFLDIYGVPVNEESFDDAEREFPQATANTDERTVNSYITNARTCSFYAADSNSVLDGRAKPSAKLRVVGDPEELLKECKALAELQAGGNRCAAIEFAGHAYHLSVGLNHYSKDNLVIIGAHSDGTDVRVFPEDQELFSEIVKCFGKVMDPDAPIVFSTCGGAWRMVQDPIGYTGYYAGKEQGQQALANALDRTVYSALGFSFGSDDGTRSPAGWHVAKPAN